MLLITSANVIHAQPSNTHIGKSLLYLNTSSLNFSGYGYYNVEGMKINFTLNLTYGTSGSTSISVQNMGSLFSNGIIAFPVPSQYQYPPFSGRISVQVSNSTPPGNYTLVLAAIGADPSPNATVSIIVPKWKGNLNTTSLQVAISKTNATSIPAVTSTSIPIIKPNQEAQSAKAITIIIAVIVIVAIGLYLRHRRKSSSLL